MAEEHLVAGRDGCGLVAVDDNHDAIPSTAPPHKSPRTNSQSPTNHTDQEQQPVNTKESPTEHRKSWRRATITRRSFPALSNPYQVLCRSISTSLSQHERLEKLMEASMKLAIERTQNTLQSMPHASLESFETQVKHMEKEWNSLAKRLHSEPRGQESTNNAASKLVLQNAVENLQKAISRLQTENGSWEGLLEKHRSKAEELERKVEQCQQTVVALGSASQSSQCLFIQSKPDYQNIIRRQQPMLQSVKMLMDTQCKIIRELQSIKEHSQLLVKEASGRLAEDAGFQVLLPDLIRNLMTGPLSSATK